MKCNGISHGADWRIQVAVKAANLANFFGLSELRSLLILNVGFVR